MNAATTSSLTPREADLAGQTVVVIGGSLGIGLETARLARAQGAKLVLAARNRERLEQVASELGAMSAAAFDATDFAPLAEFDFDRARRDVEAHLFLPMQIARNAVNKVRPGGTLLFMGGTGGRRVAKGYSLISSMTAALPALTKTLAVELAPIRVNLIAAGFVDTPLSASLLGDELGARREQLRTTLPIGRVVGPVDIAALAVHLMTNSAITGATLDIDGGQQIVEG